MLATDPTYNAVLHTTCVPTLLNAGHANNALPQRADANINCRIFPGTTPRRCAPSWQELVADPADQGDRRPTGAAKCPRARSP